jgi:hypothetical protein
MITEGNLSVDAIRVDSPPVPFHGGHVDLDGSDKDSESDGDGDGDGDGQQLVSDDNNSYDTTDDTEYEAMIGDLGIRKDYCCVLFPFMQVIIHCHVDYACT